MGLQEPRRNYINALKAYNLQLDVALKYVEKAMKPKTNQ
jgi:hypothetical protein